MEPDNTSITHLSDIEKIQYTYALDTFRFQYNLMISVISIFSTAYLALIALSIQQQIPSLSVVAFFVPIVAFLLVLAVRRHMEPFITFCVSIEKTYNIENAVISTYLESVFSQKAFEVLENILIIEGINLARKVRMLNKSTLPYFLSYSAKYIGSILALHALFSVVVFRLL